MNIEHSASFVDKGLHQVLTPKSWKILKS
jgi:hypothetical protein